MMYDVARTNYYIGMLCGMRMAIRAIRQSDASDEIRQMFALLASVAIDELGEQAVKAILDGIREAEAEYKALKKEQA